MPSTVYKDHLDREFPSVKEMCLANGVKAATYRHRARQGYALQDALSPDIHPTKACQDHLGNRYKNQGEMLEAWGLPSWAYRKRREDGWTLEQILATPLHNRDTKDHLGNTYPDKKAMAKAWGMDYAILRSRLACGWSLQKALTEPAAKRGVTDHLGNQYPDQPSMAKAYGLKPRTLRGRLERGWDLESALTLGTSNQPKDRRQFHDHLGNAFPTMKELYAHWGVNANLYKRRIQSGMTMQEALEAGSQDRSAPIACEDHLGNQYPSMSQLCSAYGVPVETYKKRIQDGCSIEKALTEPIKETNVACHDWTGREYGSIREMEAALYLKKGWAAGWFKSKSYDPEHAAEKACAKRWPGTDAGHYVVRECVAFPWFLCEDKDGDPELPHAREILLHADDILAMKSAS